MPGGRRRRRVRSGSNPKELKGEAGFAAPSRTALLTQAWVMELRRRAPTADAAPPPPAKKPKKRQKTAEAAAAAATVPTHAAPPSSSSAPPAAGSTGLVGGAEDEDYEASLLDEMDSALEKLQVGDMFAVKEVGEDPVTKEEVTEYFWAQIERLRSTKVYFYDRGCTLTPLHFFEDMLEES